MDQLDNRSTVKPEQGSKRLTLLKVLCIFSFVLCGLWIIVFSAGWFMTTNIQQGTISKELWSKIITLEPRLERVDPMTYMSELSKVSIYFLLANIVSLVGVIMMWRLNRIGFFIYIAAELVTNFFSVSIEVPDDRQLYVRLILYLTIDVLFIVLYGMNLKYMKK